MSKKKNRVKQIRTKAGISQRELAAKAGTYYQQVQRIETHQVEARLDLAIRLSKALGKTLDEVFPGAGQALAKHKREGGPYLPPSLNEFGIETDIRKWYFKFLLRGHRKPLIYVIPVQEKRRLEACLAELSERSRHEPFLVFKTKDQQVALNLKELQGWQFLYDVDPTDWVTDLKRAQPIGSGQLESSADNPYVVNIFFAGNPEAWSFTVEHDAGEWVAWNRVDDDGYLINADGKWIDDKGNLSNEGFLAAEHDEGELRYILQSLEMGGCEDDIHRFEDEDGEDVFFRAGQIALFEVSLAALEPWDAEEEEVVTSAN